jgi:hypothetical protein
MGGLSAAPAAGQFVFENEARNATLELGALIQPRYDYFSREGDEDLSSVYFRRVRLSFAGRLFSNRLTYAISPDISREATLRDAYINYVFLPGMAVRFGQYTIPFHFRISPRRGMFAESGEASSAFGHATLRDKGVMLSAVNPAGTVAFAGGIFDGAGLNTRRSNSAGMLVTSRLTVAPRGGVMADEVDFTRTASNVNLSVGVQAANDNVLRDWSLGRSPTGEREGDWVSLTADAQLQHQGLNLWVAGFQRRVSPSDVTVESYRGWGAEATAGYMLIPERLDVGVRYVRFNWDEDAEGTRESQWQAASTIYHRRHDLKTRFQFQRNQRGPEVGGIKEWTLISEMQIII